MKFVASIFRVTVVSTVLSMVVIIAGCQEESFQFAEVSGTVTLDGTPLTDASVIFMPEPKPGNSVVGPFSSGITDANGKFTLKTRYGDPGAVVGVHCVTFQYDDIEPLAVQEALLARARSANEQAKHLDQPNGNDTENVEREKNIETDEIIQPNNNDQPEFDRDPETGWSLGLLKEKLRGRRLIPPEFSLEPNIKFTVPRDGTKSADFELQSEGSGQDVAN